MRRILFVLFLHGCCCPIGGSSTPEERAAREQARQAEEARQEAERRLAIERAPRRAAFYARVHTLIDPRAAVPGADCPDDAIDAARGGGSVVTLFPPAVDYGSLPGV